MNGWFQRHRWLRLPATFLILALLPSCYNHWRASELPLPQLLSEERPAMVRVTLRNSSITLVSVTLAGDSLIGFTRKGHSRRAVAVSDIRKVDVWEFDEAADELWGW